MEGGIEYELDEALYMLGELYYRSRKQQRQITLLKQDNVNMKTALVVANAQKQEEGGNAKVEDQPEHR